MAVAYDFEKIMFFWLGGPHWLDLLEEYVVRPLFKYLGNKPKIPTKEDH